MMHLKKLKVLQNVVLNQGEQEHHIFLVEFVIIFFFFICLLYCCFDSKNEVFCEC